MHRRLGQLQPAVAAHRVHDVDQQWLRHRISGEAHQRINDLLSVVTRGSRVPQCQRSDPVGVHVFRRPLELGEGRDRGARRTGRRMIDF